MTNFLKIKRGQGNATNPHEELDTLLANFILTKHKDNCCEFELSSLRDMISIVDRKLRRHPYAHSILCSCNDINNAFNLTRQDSESATKTSRKR